MNYKKLSELKQEFLEVIVTDSISKKHYFVDSEVVGWLLLRQDEETEVYHVYRRGFDEQTNENVDEPLFFPNEKFSGEELEKEVEMMLAEAESQKRTSENKELLSKVKSFL